MKTLSFFAIAVIIFCACIWPMSSVSAEEPVVVKVHADGTAPIINGNVEKSRTAALRLAYAEAALKEKDSEKADMTMLPALKNLSDIVASRSTGLVKNYVIVNEGISERDNNLYSVTIDAMVVERGEVPEEDKESLKLYLDLLDNPRLLILVSEENNGSQMKDVSHDNDSANTLRAFETALSHKFTYYGYQVVTSDDLVTQNLSRPETLAQAKAGVTARAIEIARAAQADLALIGSIRFAADASTVQQVNLTTVTAEATLKAMIVSSGKLIDAIHHSTQAAYPRELKARSDCVDKAALEIAQYLAWKIPQMLSINYRETGLMVKNIDSSQAMSLKNFLSKITGVDSIRITQLPTPEKEDARFVIITGFIAPEAGDIAYQCNQSLQTTVKLSESTKYEVTLTVQPESP